MRTTKQKNGLGNKDSKEILMKSKKESNEKTQIVEVTGNLEDLLTEEELKQLEEDEYLDGGPGYIPTWVRPYKLKEQKKIEDGIQVTIISVTEEEIAERIRNGNYEWTEYDADDIHEFDDYTMEELEAEMEKSRKKLFGNRTDKK